MTEFTFKEFVTGVMVEAIEFYGGQKRGWENYDSIDHIPGWWWGFVGKNLAKDSKGWVPRIIDDGRELHRDEIVTHVRQRSGMTQTPQRPQQPQPTPQRPQAPTPVQRPAANQGPWFLATALTDETLPDHNGVDHKVMKDQHIALKNNGDGSWTYATIYKGKLQWHNAHTPQAELGGKFERVKGEDGKPVRGMKASQLAKSVHKEEKVDFKPTDEQQDIFDTFGKMKEEKDVNHMVIAARAGTGKTTSLKQIAKEHGKRGENWLYLVFGTENRKEAVEEFPKSWVDVHTTNSYAGRVLEANKIKPTDRMAQFSDTEKIKEIIDGQQYKQIANSLNIVNVEHVPEATNIAKGYLRGIWREFNVEVEKLVGLAKAYNISPEEAEEGITRISKEHDINTSLERTREKLEKDNHRDWANEQISEAMGVGSFLQENFLKRMISASAWLLDMSQPHGIDQDFIQTKEKDKYGKWKRLDKPITRNLKTIRDFNDDLYYVSQHADELDWTKPKKYQYILVDEVQDFNISQKIMLEHLVKTGARIVAVGDINQCHPAGTIVSMTGGEQKPIEEIQEGDQVVGYNSSLSKFTDKKLLGIAKRPYRGSMITIQTKENKVEVTPNHKCLIRIKENNMYALYLMTKGKNARVGISYLNKSGRGCGPKIRARQEGADKLWILDVFDSKEMASMNESLISVKFGLPQNVFCSPNDELNEFSNRLWNIVGGNVNKVSKCLAKFGKDINYPMWAKDNDVKIGRNLFLTQACNLLPSAMEIIVSDKGIRKWVDFDIITKDMQCDVYSLSVENSGKHNLYVANNIVVSNSMYRFRGADETAFQDITSMLTSNSANPERTQKVLTHNFRSKHGIIDHSNKSTVVNDLKAGIKHDENDPAHISDKEIKYDETMDRLGKEYDSLGEMKKQTALIARTNEPLARAAMDLMKHKIPFVIYGKDMAGSIIGLVNRVLAWQKYKVVNDQSDLHDFHDELNDFVNEKKEKWSGKATKSGALKDLMEAHQAIAAALTVANEQIDQPDVDSFKKWLYKRLGGVDENMSKSEKAAHKKRLAEENPVILTTAHKSKGLEFERVFELTPSLYPHPRTKLDADFDQEENARYVAGTRAKDEYHVVDDQEDDE